jgi:hypothetical protein
MNGQAHYFVLLASTGPTPSACHHFLDIFTNGL